MHKIENYIDGKLISPLSNRYLENRNPATGLLSGEIPRSNQADVDLAFESAEKAFPEWSGFTKEKRSRILLKLADLIDRDANELALAESQDNGKPITLAKRVDIPRASANIRFFATAILHHKAESYHMEQGYTNYTMKQAIGVVGCISPWNLPLYLFTWKIAPALAVGNCVLAKPTEITPLTAYLFSKLCIEAGLPAGVLNVLHGLGNEVGDSIVSHPKIKAISFTGGTSTGKIIARKCADSFKKISLELGGKNPNILFADCDLEQAVKTSVQSSFSNQGQICLCGSRIYVERPIYEAFKKAFIEKTKQLVIGDPLNEKTSMGALVSKDHLDKVMSYVELAKQEGGTVLYGGVKVEVKGFEKGNFMLPTIIEGLDATCRTNQEEIFGPVVTLTPFDSEEEAIDYANSTKYGLSASVWTSNVGKAQRVSTKLEAGMIWINCWLVRDLRTPFGGMKQSGVGREGGFKALDFFTEVKNVCINHG